MNVKTKQRKNQVNPANIFEREEMTKKGAGIDALQRGQGLSYYHRDEQLSTAFITGRDGEIQNGYLYDAFGTELEAKEQFQNRIRYTGQQYDDLTVLSEGKVL